MEGLHGTAPVGHGGLLTQEQVVHGGRTAVGQHPTATAGTVVQLPMSHLVTAVDQLLRRNAEIIALTSHNLNTRDPAKLQTDNVQLLKELDANLHKILSLYQEFGSRIA